MQKKVLQCSFLDESNTEHLWGVDWSRQLFTPIDRGEALLSYRSGPKQQSTMTLRLEIKRIRFYFREFKYVLLHGTLKSQQTKI